MKKIPENNVVSLSEYKNNNEVRNVEIERVKLSEFQKISDKLNNCIEIENDINEQSKKLVNSIKNHVEWVFDQLSQPVYKINKLTIKAYKEALFKIYDELWTEEWYKLVESLSSTKSWSLWELLELEFINQYAS